MSERPARHTAEERRTEITAAAAIEFARRGLDGATTDRIAERAGVSQPYVVRLFGTKKALFLAVANRAFERIADAFRAAAVGDGPEERLENMGAAYVALLSDRDELALQLQLYAAAYDPEIRTCVATRFAQLHELCGELSGAEPGAPAGIHRPRHALQRGRRARHAADRVGRELGARASRHAGLVGAYGRGWSLVVRALVLIVDAERGSRRHDERRSGRGSGGDRRSARLGGEP